MRLVSIKPVTSARPMDPSTNQSINQSTISDHVLRPHETSLEPLVDELELTLVERGI